MICIKGDKIILRSVDFSDIDTLLLWENANDEPLYGVYEEEFSREDVVRFVELQQQYSLAETEQLRLMICSHDGARLGSIDLTDYDGKKADVSIIIPDQANRRQGYAEEALHLMVDYAKSLGLRELYATIHPENIASIKLFSKVGFVGCDEGCYRYKF